LMGVLPVSGQSVSPASTQFNSIQFIDHL